MTQENASIETVPGPDPAVRLWLALATQEARLASLEDQLSQMRNSRSWRVTAPLRAVRACLAGATRQPESRPALEREASTLGEGMSAGFPIPGLAPLLDEPGDTPRLLVDVTELALEDLGAGVQRVTRRLLSELLLDPPVGFSMVPVRLAPGIGYCRARGFLASALGLDGTLLGMDEPVEARAGDRFIGLDFCRDRAPELGRALDALRRAGTDITLLVHDVLPLSHPQWFPEWVSANYESWLGVLSSRADRAVCISACTAEQLARVMSERKLPLPPGGLAVMTPGSDLPPSPVSRRQALPRKRASTIRVLTVGTIEPRKGHAQALDAFEALWSRGTDIEWVIVGRPGWDVAGLLRRLRRHPEAGRRLHWLDDADDVALGAAYRTSDTLLAPSHGEGFGLPLVEAGRLGLRLVLRDLSVFREVAGEAAAYFQGEAPESIVQALLDRRSNTISQSERHWNTWADSARELSSIVTERHIPRGDAIGGRGRQE